MGKTMVESSQTTQASDREAALRELIQNLETRSSSSTADLFQTATKDLSATKKLFYGGGSVVVFVMSTVGGWVMDAIEKQQKQVDTIEAQSKVIEELKVQIRLGLEQQRQLGRRVVANEVLIVDSAQWLADKIDAGRRSAKEERPRSVSAAKRRIDDAGTGMGTLFQLDSLAHQ